jgi:hypothetical protein
LLKQIIFFPAALWFADGLSAHHFQGEAQGVRPASVFNKLQQGALLITVTGELLCWRRLRDAHGFDANLFPTFPLHVELCASLSMQIQAIISASSGITTDYAAALVVVQACQ